jgi:outer membrane protein assembly factor BamB
MMVLRCPHCGGMSPSATGEPGVYFCRFCNARFRDAPPAPQPAPVLVVRPVRTGGGGGGALVPVAVAGGLVLVGGLVVVLTMSRSAPKAPPPKVVASPPAVVKPIAKTADDGEAIAPKKAKAIAWASSHAFPIGVDVDGDGAEDLVGPTLKQDGANAQLWVSAFDGKTFDERWSVGPFGAPQKGKDVDRELQVATAGKRVVVLDPKGDAHLYELDSGKLVADFPFREEHRGMCGPPAAEPKVLVRVGKGDFVIDTATGKGANGAPPAWCAGDKYMRRRPSESYNSYFGVQSEKLQDIGFTRERLAALQAPPKATLSFAFADGPLVVGVGAVKGSEEAMLYGFDAKGASTYQVAGAAFGLDRSDHGKDLAFGRFVFVTGDGKLVSVDAKTGEKQWATALVDAKRQHVDRIAITGSRVWLARRLDPGASSAFVEGFDAATGKRLGGTAD